MSGRQGMRQTVPMHVHQQRAKIWQAMRILRRFLISDLASTSEVPRKHAAVYLHRLRRAEYVREVQPRSRAAEAVYQLVRNTGPLAPRLGKHGITDPNLEPAKPEPGDELVTLKRRDYEHAVLCVRACAGLTDEELRVRAAR